MFSSCNKLESVNFGYCDFSNIETMYSMFSGCNSLKSVTMLGPINPKVFVDNMFVSVPANGTFYYNPEYNYSKIIAKLPST